MTDARRTSGPEPDSSNENREQDMEDAAHAAGSTPRQLVLCFDGTNNNLTGGQSDTNVVKLCSVLAPSADQLVYYDPGVGNPGSIPGVTFPDMVRGKLERLWGLALGKGIYENIEDAYIFLMRNWRPGDRIYVFGFSRGAFTARSLAGMVARFGILLPSMEGLVPTLIHLYFADPGKTAQSQRQHHDISAQLGADFCSSPGATAEIWFVGVWDTVESVGSPFSRRRIMATGSIIGKRFRHVRQALALDEHRRSFMPRPYYIHPTYDYQAHGQSIDQQWWTGAHCDIGGGYEEDDSELSDQCFFWMLQEAAAAGLQLRRTLSSLAGVINRDEVVRTIRMEATQRPAVVHSETFFEAYWALTGLCVRDVFASLGGKDDPPPRSPVQHATPAGKPLRMPEDTIWSRPQKTRMGAAIFAGLVFWLLHAVAISGDTLLEGMSAWNDWQGLWAGIKHLSEVNLTLAHWQLFWIKDGPGALQSLALRLPHPLWMVWMDFAFILSYGYLLSLGLARGFAHLAGLRDVNGPPPRYLNLLGRSGTVIVMADLVEDFLLLLCMAASWMDWALFSDLFAALMTIASVVKWLAVIPALALVAGSLVGRRTNGSIAGTAARST
jgi:uncharacterized protein (DUF2235 family)